MVNDNLYYLYSYYCFSSPIQLYIHHAQRISLHPLIEIVEDLTQSGGFLKIPVMIECLRLIYLPHPEWQVYEKKLNGVIIYIKQKKNWQVKEQKWCSWYRTGGKKKCKMKKRRWEEAFTWIISFALILLLLVNARASLTLVFAKCDNLFLPRLRSKSPLACVT